MQNLSSFLLLVRRCSLGERPSYARPSIPSLHMSKSLFTVTPSTRNHHKDCTPPFHSYLYCLRESVWALGNGASAPHNCDCFLLLPLLARRTRAAYPLHTIRLTRSVFQCHRKLMLIVSNPFHPHLHRLSIQPMPKVNMRRIR